MTLVVQPRKHPHLRGCSSLLTSCNSIINNDLEEVMRIDNIKQILEEKGINSNINEI